MDAGSTGELRYATKGMTTKEHAAIKRETIQLRAVTNGLPAVSIVIPTFNEERAIAALLRRVDVVFREIDIVYEIIVVDDRSTDHTVREARKAAMVHRLPIRIFIKQGQHGKSYSLIEGFARSRYPILGMIDADLQYPPEAFATMYERLRTAHIVVADRRASYEQLVPQRGKLSNAFNAQVIGRLFHIDADVQSGMKMFYRSVYESFALRPTPWSFDLDFLGQAQHAGYDIENVPIAFAPRVAGTSKVRPVRVGVQLFAAAIRLYLWLLMSPVVVPLMRWGIIPQSERYRAKPETNPNVYAEADLLQQMREWLRIQTYQSTLDPHHTITASFTERAERRMVVGGTESLAFSALDPLRSAQETFRVGQIIALALTIAVWFFCFIVFTTPTLVLTISLIIVFYFKNMLDTTRMSLSALNAHDEFSIEDNLIDELQDVRWPRYTILCPLYNEVEVVPQFVHAMQALEYPAERLQVLFLTEENDAATREAIEALQLPPHFQILVVPPGKPQTKPRACNFGLMHATGDFIVIYDAEDIPEPRQLKKAVLTFAQSEQTVACVQAKLNFYNARQNILTRLFTIEYTMWFDLLLPGMQRARLSLPLGGTSNHFRTAVLRKLGGWDPFNVTEDCDLGLRLAQEKLTTVVLDSVTMEEGNSNLRNWIRQRSRWIKGYLQTYLVHMRRPWRYLRRGMFREFSSLQFIIGGTPATFFLNPIMWAMLGVYIAARPEVEATYRVLYPGPVFYLGVICFVFGNYLYICLSMLACMKRGEYRLMRWALLLPIYWLMMSVAALVALAQLIWKPHYWEKTKHGLHLKRQRQGAETLTFATSQMRAVGKGK
jgi:cellulose synthase/poly-beta-1,6-N-acetylglucosamine synthase-like glycosyltransferase